MSLRALVLSVAACAPLLCAPARSAEPAEAAAKVGALADRFVAEYRARFPMSYAFSGLPVERHDGLDANAPADIAAWNQLLQGMGRELEGIPAEALAGRPDWVTRQFLRHAIREAAATEVCRNELWSVSPLGWQSSLSQVAGIQPVGSEAARADALARWRKLGPWIDQEIANLREGQRLGYSATQAAVRATVGQLDALLADAPESSGFMEVARRDGTAAFATQWAGVIREVLWPALARYRAFLRDEYLPRARTAVSIESHPGGRDCYRARIFSTTTLDVDPAGLFDLATAKVAEEQATALRLGRSIYGERASDWATLAALMKEDPRNRFADAEEVRAYTQATIDRAEAARGRMVLAPPVARVVIEPFPEFQQPSAPGGQYIPAADDGSRTAVYLYRNLVGDLYRLSLQNVILHETWPGHHLQVALLAERGGGSLHPLARLLYFSGPGEGWATYAEEFAREIGLYDSDLDYIGGLMASITPMMVVDLGMQTRGWTPEQAAAYLEKAMPMRPASRVAQSVALISSLPGFVLAYPLGGIEWARMRERAEQALGERFDVRAFHQMLLEDGMLPFAALEAKLERWITRGGQ